MIDKESVVRTEHDFLQWLSGAAFYVGRCRYAQFPGNFVIATGYDYDDALRDHVSNLDAGDNEALDAAYNIRAMAGEKRFPNDTSPVGKKQILYSAHDDPSVAMTDVVGQLRRFYFDVLSGIIPEVVISGKPK